jgi:hypothetical protein
MYRTVLETKAHNRHYLIKYCNFIERCIAKNESEKVKGYTESHHICPKSKNMFPEYKNLKEFPWNKAVLTPRQHIIAHMLLYKTFNTECQLLAVLLTSVQKNNKKIDTKSVEYAKILLSEHRKGKFPRGYNEDGKANVSEKTKQKLSKIKTEFYKNPENRRKQSERCTGKKKKNTENIKAYSKDRTKSHLDNIKNSVKKYYDNLTPLERKRVTQGIYCTPFGNFSSIGVLNNYCKNNENQITVHSCKDKNSLFIKEFAVGKTPKELGYSFIQKDDPRAQQYYESLNQVRLPLPNHLHESKLNDFLSHKMFLL